jgi:glycosyltransferase involved in cell wall biosynthesis
MSKTAKTRGLSKILENTSLDLIRDNRSGERLEIVIPVFNEEKRIANILNYYKDFDIVLLDGGSTDQTIQMAINSGATIFSRIGDEGVGENHFTYYVNQITKSGYCFYMMADEFINNNDLKECAEHLKNKNSVIRVRKIEWIYGEKPRANMSKNLGMARGFVRGSAAYSPYSLHNSLHYSNNFDEPVKIYIYDLHHLHLKSIKDEYGRVGRYLDVEVNQFRAEKSSFFKYFRRYVIPVLMLIFWRVWFNKTTIQCKFFNILELTVTALLALMCWMEQNFFPSTDTQLRNYSSYYSNKTEEIFKD